LLASVAPTESELFCDCICPYNVSFTVHDLEPNSFYFSCLWFTGKVELTEGMPLTLTDDKMAVSIDEFSYTLHTTSGGAVHSSHSSGHLSLQQLDAHPCA